MRAGKYGREARKIADKGTGGTMKKGSRARNKMTCQDCFFHCNLLCALELDEPCATFRADTPEGLVPPSQLALVARDEGALPAPGADGLVADDVAQTA